MSNIFTPTGREPTYITIKEVRDSTEKQGIQTSSDKAISVLISKAEKAIDKYMGYRLDLSEARDDEISDIKIATLYVVEQIYENDDTIVPVSTAGGDIIEEATGDRRVKYSETKTSNNKNQLLGIPDVAKSVLDKYKRSFYKQVI